MRSNKRFNAKQLHDFGMRVLTKGGLSEERASIVATTLLESDLMGHPTHGLALLAPYLTSIKNGHMTLEGEPEVLRDQGGSITWNGNLLPGTWLVHKAIDLAFERVKYHPVTT